MHLPLTKQKWIHAIFIMHLIWWTPTICAQTDSLVLTNGNLLIGEIKSMENSVLVIETPYSKNDFTIKWAEVSMIHTTNVYLITLDDGRWIRSNLQSIDHETLRLTEPGLPPIEVNRNDIVYLKELESGIWGRITASADIGLNLTKANNQRQFNLQARLGYLAQHFGSDIYYEEYTTRQDSVEPIKRKEGGFNTQIFLDDDWYIMPQIGYLSNTEQALWSRLTPTLGAGRFLARTNRYYWGVMGGISMNIESFTNDTDNRKSAELYIGTGVNLFEFGDLDLYATGIVYPSLTEKGRVRTDAKINTKYEFLDDFYVKFSMTYNYDNQPAIMGNESDYVFGVSFGWEKD